MPTATLTFDLNDPDERRAHLECLKASDIIMVVYDLNTFLREKLKWAELTEEQYKVYETVSDKLHELVNESDLSNLIFE